MSGKLWHRPRSARPRSTRRLKTAATLFAASGIVAALVASTSSSVPVAAAVRSGPPHGQTGVSSVWAGNQWASGTGNQISDIAKIIGVPSNLDGTGVGIALIDTGVVPAPGLPASHIVNGPDLSFESQSADLRYLDTYGHGTHLAGIMVGNDPSSGLRGIAPGAKLTSIKVGTANGTVDVSQVIAALDWVVAHRNDDPANPIKVVCLAYGTDAIADPTNDPLLLAVENAGKAGIAVVAAAGNNGSSFGRVDSPGVDRFVLTVGSVATQGTTNQSDDTLSTFTSTDPTTPLDIVVPGESVVSVRDPGSYIDATYPAAEVGTTLFRGSGTSQAAAVVAGAVALVLQKSPSTPPHELREWLRQSATPIKSAKNVTYGELNLTNALKKKAPKYDALTDFSSGLGSLETARGSSHVVDDNTILQGQSTVFGPFDSARWAAASNAGTAWKGGQWMGVNVAGDGWTGTSWASKTWATVAWAGSTWANEPWPDTSWSGHYWSGHYWSSDDWSGHYWSASTWDAKNWASRNWESKNWASSNWATANWG